MTPEEYLLSRRALTEQERDIERKFIALDQEYIKSLPFKIGDCVKIKDFFGTIEKCRIVSIEVYANNPRRIRIEYKIQNGARSFRRGSMIVNLSDVELLNDES